MFHKILKVAQREYAETVKTKTFILGVLMTPLIIGGIIYFSSRYAHSGTGPRPPKQIVILDRTDALKDEIRSFFTKHNNDHKHQQIDIVRIHTTQDAQEVIPKEKNRVRRRELDAFVVLDTDILDGAGTMQFYMRDTKTSDMDYIGTVENLINRAVVNKRCQRENIAPEVLARLRPHVRLLQIEVGEEIDQERVQEKAETITRTMIPFFFMFLIYYGIIGIGQHLLTSVIEEKNSRIMEVLLSALSPFELMAGKIVGLAIVGFTIMSIWCVAAYSTARWQKIMIPVELDLLIYFVIYYVLGFLFFSSILVGIGSVCNTIKEAQSLMMPVTMILIIPLVGWINMIQDPHGTFAVVLSFIPPTTPLVMILRICASSEPVPIVEILISIFLLATCIPLTIWAAAKVFRTGILMYGKRPALKEIIRWLRQS
jgi:ABC-2 type transport system permease protein